MGSAILKIPELALDAKEAHALAEAASNVLKYYPIALDEKTSAWVNLGMVGMGIYGTRALAFHNRLKSERLRRLTPAPGPVPTGPIPVANGVGMDFPVPPVD